MKKLHVTLVTPERVAYESDIDSLTVMTANGQISVLPDHEPLLTTIVAGELTVTKDASTTLPFVVGQGVLEVLNNTVKLLVNSTEMARDIDIERAEAAIERAQKAMQEKAGQYDEEYARLEALIARNLARIKIKGR